MSEDSHEAAEPGTLWAFDAERGLYELTPAMLLELGLDSVIDLTAQYEPDDVYQYGEDMFYGLDGLTVMDAAHEHFTSLIARARGVHHLLLAGDQKLARLGRPSIRRGGRKRAFEHGRFKRQVVLDSETVMIWDRHPGDKSAGVRRLLRQHGIPMVRG